MHQFLTNSQSRIAGNLTHLFVVKPVRNLLPVHVHSVVVELGVVDQAHPLSPTRWHSVPVVLVQIFAEVP